MGDNLERGQPSARRHQRKNIAVKTLIFLVLVLLTFLAFPLGERFSYTVQVGEEWHLDSLVAPIDFPIFKDPSTLQSERQEIRRKTSPYFEERPNAQALMSRHRDTLALQLDAIFDAYGAYRVNFSLGLEEAARRDSARYLDLRRTARLKLASAQWQLLADDYAARLRGLVDSTRLAVEVSRLDETLLQQAWEFGMQFIHLGVLEIPLDSIRTEEIIVRNRQDGTERVAEKHTLYDVNDVYMAASEMQLEGVPDASERVNITSALLRAIFVPSLQYMRAETLRSWQQAEDRISPTRGKVAQGEVIVYKGQLITEEVKRKLTSLEQAQTLRSGTTFQWTRSIGQLLLLLATYTIFFLYLYMVRRRIFDDNGKILLIALLFAVMIGLFAIAIRVPSPVLYVVPIAMMSVLLTVMFDSRVGLFGTLTLALIGALLLGYDFEFAFVTLFAGTLGVFSVRDIKNRGQFFISAGMVFLGYLITMAATSLFLGRPIAALGTDLLLVGINSFFLLLAYPLLWIFERTFDITTDLTLLELSDTNRPLLKELSLRAPGTFNHSLQVANLAEAAANAIGANALLTRVGALYHDIGKMAKPEYFVENQRTGHNPHDALKPRMSALIIASHVKEGMEMGRQHKLPQRVLDFIPMHHGSTRIEYFFQKALKELGEEEAQTIESEFRYPGPRPNTKETAILMLSDGVEAASKSLAEPTHKRLETLIDMIVQARIADGQLAEAALTFRDLSIIKETFLSLLLGIYHIRIKYPGQDQEKGGKQVAPAPVQEADRDGDTEGVSIPSGETPNGNFSETPIEAVQTKQGDSEPV